MTREEIESMFRAEMASARMLFDAMVEDIDIALEGEVPESIGDNDLMLSIRGLKSVHSDLSISVLSSIFSVQALAMNPVKAAEFIGRRLG